MQVFIPGVISRCLHTHTHTHTQVMQAFIPGVISRCLRKPASHAGISLYLVLSADVCATLLVMQAFIRGVISRCLRKPASHAAIYTWCYQQMSVHTCQSHRHLYLVLLADVCAHLLVMQVFIPGVISRCLRTPASHADIYTWCYQEMSAHTPTSHTGIYTYVCTNLLILQVIVPDVISIYMHTCQSCKNLHLVFSADDSTNLQVMQFVPLAWWQHGIQLSQ